jgi:hypothetical protein
VRLVQAEIDEEAILHGLRVVVEEGRPIGLAPEESEGITVDEVGWSSSQTNHARIEVLDNFGQEQPD